MPSTVPEWWDRLIREKYPWLIGDPDRYFVLGIAEGWNPDGDLVCLDENGNRIRSDTGEPYPTMPRAPG